MLFRISNQVQHDLHTHCGVLEFVAEEGRVYLPQWVRENGWVSVSASSHDECGCVDDGAVES